MKNRSFTRLLAALLAALILITALPLSILASSGNTYATNDYTPFLIESAGSNAVYNIQTADMCYDFYLAARSYIDDFAGDVLHAAQEGEFSFHYNNNTYTPESVYFSKPREYPSCGLLTGILNYQIGNSTHHIVLVAFRGSDQIEDWITDAAVATGKDGYHNGFEETAQRHYEAMQASVNFSLGDGSSLSFAEYLTKMSAGNGNYSMIVTGHSLGAAVAGVFTSKYLDNKNGITAANAVAYTFASPLTCSDAQAIKEADVVGNVFNIVNSNDVITKIGADLVDGKRTGQDLKYRLKKYGSVAQNWMDFYGVLGITSWWNQVKKTFKDIGNNHHMGTAYLPTKDYIHANLTDYTDCFVLYNNYNAATHTYQRITYSNGQLLVSGIGALAGNWSDNTLIAWEKVKNSCTSLLFKSDCSITEIGDHAFSGMSSLTNQLELPSSLVKIGDYAFFHCGFSGKLTISSYMQYVGAGAFNGCSNLSSIDAISALGMTWGYGAFANCVAQSELLLPGADIGTDLAQIFSTYYVEDANGAYTITAANGGTNEIVLPGDKIYMGRIEDDKLNIRPYYDFHYLLTTGHVDTSGNIQSMATTSITNVASVNDSGCITIASACPAGTEFTVVIMDNLKGDPDYNVYDSNRFLHFTVGVVNTHFAGGLGTAERPYLIKNYDQLVRIKDHLSAHYQFIADIDCAGQAEWTSIGSSSAAFSGVLDGNGYTISNLAGYTLFAYNEGTIKNLTLSGCSITQGSNAVAILVGENRSNGTITNCLITNSTINITYSYNSGDCKHNVGGFSALNYGNISNCSITNSTVKGYARGGDGHYNVYLNVGGIAASNLSTGNVNSCSSFDNVIYGYIYHNGIGGALYNDNKSYAYFRVGGVIGYAEGGAVNATAYYNNSVTRERKYYDHNGVDDSKYAIIKEDYTSGGIAKSDVTVTCNEDVARRNVIKSVAAISAKSVTHKTHYYIGEALNLYGLQVRDNNGNLINDYQVSGYDSNKSGTQTITVSYTTGYGTFKDVFTVIVDNIIPIAVVVFPKKAQYDINKTLTVDDLTATIYYNNGTTEFMASLRESESDIVKFTSFTNVLDEINDQVVQLSYYYAYMTPDGKAAASSSIVTYAGVNVTCACPSTTSINEMTATTLEYGYSGDLVCTVCGVVVKEGNILDMLPCTSHSYGEWSKYDDTHHVHSCLCGVKEYAPHTWGEGVTTTEATHTSTGIKMYACTSCTATKTETLPILADHTYDQEVVSIQYLKNAATCTNPAAYYKSCECGAKGTDTFTYGALAEHEYGTWQIYDGTHHVHLCACGEKELAVHTWDAGVVTTAATHMSTGIKTYTCTACSETKEEEIPTISSAHACDKEIAATKYLKTAATCTTAAIYYKSCECGEVGTETFVYGSPNGHSYGAWQKYNNVQHVHHCECGATEYADHSWDAGEITAEATHMSEGTKTYTCTDCDATKTETLPMIAAHTYDREIATTRYLKTAASCTNAAVYYKSCECGAKGTETFLYGSAKGHNYGTWQKYNDTQHSRSCSCGNVDYASHVWDDGSVTLAPSYTATGIKTHSCAYCSATKTSEIPVLTIPNDAPYILVDSKTAFAGEAVTINISLQDNPGITSMRVNVAYDSNLLTLTSITYNTAWGGYCILPDDISALNGLVVLYWTNGFTDHSESDVFATLTFTVVADVSAGDKTMIGVTYDAEDIYNTNEENITFVCKNGEISFADYVRGDINGDGVLNSKDTTRLMRYLAGWDVQVNPDTLDVNGDGVVNTKDVTRLMRYLAGWNVEIY